MKSPLWLRAFKRSLATTPVRRPSAALRCEPLEDRAVPATLDTFLTTEHVDLNVGYAGGQWSLQPRDADNGGVGYDPDVALLYVGTPALTQRVANGPNGNFDFIGVGAGESFYRLPESQNPELLYLGVAGYGVTPGDFDRYNPAAESKGRVGGNGRWLKVSLVGVQHTTPSGAPGDGHFSVWQSGDTGPRVFMSSYDDGVSNPDASGLDATDGIGPDDALWIIAGGHLHYNWGFTRPGRYEVQVKLSGYLGDGGSNNGTIEGTYAESGPFTLYFSVGSVGQVSFDAAAYTVDESAGTATVTVRRAGGSDGRIRVNYATSDGTATAGGDYTAVSGTLTFNDGETVKTITVPILDDTVEEGDETVNLALSAPAPASIQNYLIDFQNDPNGLLGAQSTAVLTILANDSGTNTPPTISDVPDQGTDEGTPKQVTFTVGDAQTPAGDLVVTATSSNTALVPNGNLVLGGSGASRTLTIAPAANLSGATTITLTVTDAGGLTATDTFVLTVNPVNDLPTISPIDDVVMDEDGNVTINFTVGDVETPAGSLVVTGTRTNTALFPSIGTTSTSRLRLGGSGANRTLQIRPAANLHGESFVTLRVTDAGGGFAERTFKITVNSVYDPPVVRADNLLGVPGTTSTFDLLANDTPGAEPGQTFALTSFTQPANGTVVAGAVPGTVRYTPNAGYTGADQFTYTVTDNTGVAVTGTAYVTVAPNQVVDAVHTDIRAAYADGAWSLQVHADLPFGSPNAGGSQNPTRLDYDEAVLLANPASRIALPGGLDPATFSFLGVAPGGQLWLLPQSQQPGVLWPGFSTESIAPGTFAAYTPTGDPRATANAAWIRFELVDYRVPTGGVFSMYTTGGFGAPTVWWDSIDGANGVPESAHGGNVSDTYWITPNTHDHVNWTFSTAGRYEMDVRVRAFVNQGGTLVEVVSPVATLHFDVDAVTGLPTREAPPLARPDTATAAEGGGPLAIDVLANDSSAPDPLEALAVTAVTQPANGTAAIRPDGGGVLYTPNAGFSGTDTFTYTVTDEHGGAATAAVTVTVSAVNGAPVAAADAYAVSPGNAVRGNVLFNDADPDGDALSAVLVSGPAAGALALNPDGTFTYTPGPNFAGTDVFTYRASDGAASSAAVTVTVTAAAPQAFETVLTAGHADVGIAFGDHDHEEGDHGDEDGEGHDEGAWDLHVHDEEGEAEYEPAGALLFVGPQALTARAGGLAGSAFDFLGVAAGESFYRLPQSENPELLYLGIGAEELEGGTFLGDAVTLRLKAVNGPGQFSLWQSGDLGPALLMATSDGITAADRLTVQAGSHAHYNWGFSARGRYEVTFEAVATLPDGTAVASGDVTYYFSVDNLGRVQFAPGTYAVAEGGSVTLTVVRVGGSDGPLSVDYGPAGGTASDGDYAPFGGTLTFADGETARTFTVSAATDAAAEGAETVVVALAAPPDSPTELGAPAEAVVTITDVPPAPQPAPPAPPAPVGTARPAQLIVLGSVTPGVVRVLDAPTGTALREFRPFPGYAGAVAVAAGDVTGDGIADVIAATASGSSHVKVFDGATGAEVRSFLAFPGHAGGVTVAAGDVDGDGRADIVVGTATGSSHVKVISGRTGEELHSFLAYSGYLGGVRVAAADVVGDGRADVVVVTNPGGDGHVKAFDGATGALGMSFLGYAGYAGEVNLAAGDVDGDGRAEVVTVAHNPAGAHVKAFAGAGGDLVRSYLAPDTATGFGGTGPGGGSAAWVAAGDVTGDRVAEILLGSQPAAGPGRLAVLDGTTQQPVAGRAAFDPLFGFVSLGLN